MPATRPKDACDLLDAQHRAVKKLFKDYDELTRSRARSAAQKRMDLGREICHELVVHTQIEEEIFYPALRRALKETGLIDEAQVEHRSVQDLIAQVQEMDQADAMFDARIKVIGDFIELHIKEEKNELFPKARAARKLDLVAMREELEARYEALKSELEEAA